MKSKYIDLHKLMVFNYYVIFKTETVMEKDYSPLIEFNKNDYSKTMHIWDNNLNNIIPALWYILHLPRIGFDVLTMDIDLIMNAHDEAHNIVPLPYKLNDRSYSEFVNNNLVNPTLIICEDDIYESLMMNLDISKSKHGIFKISELSSDLLKIHWELISDNISSITKENRICDDYSFIRLTTIENRNILPLIPIANQFGYLPALFNNEIKQDLNTFNLNMHYQLVSLAHKISVKDEYMSKKLIGPLNENLNFRPSHLVVTMPGITNVQSKFFNRERHLPYNEHNIVNILGYHRAIAKNALYINIDEVPRELYEELHNLEIHCKDSKKINNNYIWRTLRRIGRIINSKLRNLNINIIEDCSQITVFSDFPIGLGILPGCSAPLCCIKPITYRPLTPLTRTFQNEIAKGRQIYFGSTCKILIIECIEKDDAIRKYCDNLSRVLSEMVKEELHMEIVIEEVSSIEMFKEVLKKHNNTDILLVSAHGHYDIKRNMAGIVIGHEIWMATEDDIFMPPVVLLSACHVTPRGSGAVTVGDLFIRSGAIAVLGTFIPVNVNRNAILITRLFTNIIQVRNGWSKMRTLDDIWCHTVSTNAIHEILASNNGGISKLEVWANTKNNQGTFPQKEFKENAKLRKTHIYEDSEKALYKLAERDGIGPYFDATISSHSYFPESIFYQFIGQPENVFIRNSIMESFKNTVLKPSI